MHKLCIGTVIRRASDNMDRVLLRNPFIMLCYYYHYFKMFRCSTDAMYVLNEFYGIVKNNILYFICIIFKKIFRGNIIYVTLEQHVLFLCKYRFILYTSNYILIENQTCSYAAWHFVITLYKSTQNLNFKKLPIVISLFVPRRIKII